jgi:hypothetical protein
MRNEPRLPIKPTKDEPRCNELRGLWWPTPCLVALPSGAEAVISVFLPHIASIAKVVQS